MTGSTASVSMLKHWREAATLMIVVPSASPNRTKLSFALTGSGARSRESSHGTEFPTVKRSPALELMSQDYDILMLKRSTKSKFMPNKYVYPGGVAVNNDFSSGWLSLFDKVGKHFQKYLFSKLAVNSSVAAPLFSRKRDPQFSQIPPEVAFRICAIRETFEESGILIGCPAEQLDQEKIYCSGWTYSPSSGPSSSPMMKQWRERVNNDPDEFLKMCSELNIIPAIWTLYEWSNWLTPIAATEKGRRFDTIFFICCLDHKPEAFEDAAETVSSLWAQPSSLLSSYYQEQRNMAAPQIYELSRMLNFNLHTDLLDYVVQREPQRVERWLPIAFLCKDFILSILPGDSLYPKDPEASLAIPFLQCEKTMEELNQEQPHFHRFYFVRNPDMKERFPYFMQCNTEIGRGQVAPVTGFEKLFSLKSKL